MNECIVWMNVIDQKPWQIHYCIIFHHSCFIIQLHYDWWNTSFYLEPQWTKSMNRQTTKRFIREPFRLFICDISTISQCNWHFKGQMAFSCITWKSTLFSSLFSQEIWLTLLWECSQITIYSLQKQLWLYVAATMTFHYY